MFYCRNLTGHTGGVGGIEFSEDGTLLASGGYDKIVRLWSIGKTTGNEQRIIDMIEMKTKHKSDVLCLAISPDNGRLFSGGKDGKVFIHDISSWV